MALPYLSTTDFVKAWYVYDKDRSGSLESSELKNFLKDTLVKNGFDANDEVIEAHEKAMIELYDINKNGLIHISELSKAISIDANFIPTLQSFTVNDFEIAFKSSDEDGNGTLESNEVPGFLNKLFEERSSDQIESIKTTLTAICESHGGKLTKDDLKIFFH